MSFYSWLSGNMEMRHNWTIEKDLSNPQYIDWQPVPPMALFVTEIDKEKIKEYVLEVLDEKYEEQIDEIVEKVIEKINQGEQVNVEELISSEEENGEIE